MTPMVNISIKLRSTGIQLGRFLNNSQVEVFLANWEVVLFLKFYSWNRGPVFQNGLSPSIEK